MKEQNHPSGWELTKRFVLIWTFLLSLLTLAVLMLWNIGFTIFLTYDTERTVNPKVALHSAIPKAQSLHKPCITQREHIDLMERFQELKH
jgi:hypothetical protein